jgi:hypothetical protein
MSVVIDFLVFLRSFAETISDMGAGSAAQSSHDDVVGADEMILKNR